MDNDFAEAVHSALQKLHKGQLSMAANQKAILAQTKKKLRWKLSVLCFLLGVVAALAYPMALAYVGGV